MNIALAYNTVFGQSKESDEDILDSTDAVFESLINFNFNVDKICFHENIFDTLIKTNWEKYDAVFNLVESIKGCSDKEMCFPAFLEMIEVPYTGSPPKAIMNSLDKVFAKKLFINENIPTAKFVALSEIKSYEDLIDYLEFPIIIKPQSEDGSIGITKDSIITSKNLKQIITKINLLKEELKVDLFAEEFIEGREFNISILETSYNEYTVLPVAELFFSKTKKNIPNICSYESKWSEDSEEYKNSTPIFEFDIEPAVLNSIKEISLKAFKLFGCRGYGRVDLRVKNGIPYVLEVNANPCITPGAGFVKASEKFGLSYDDMVRQIILATKNKKILQ